MSSPDKQISKETSLSEPKLWLAYDLSGVGFETEPLQLNSTLM